MRLLFAVLLILAVPPPDAPIITRHDTPDDAYLALADRLPVTAALVRYGATDVAGTLVAPRWLLSAAHVAETMEPGQYLLTHTGDSIAVARIVLHPGWVEDGRPEDIALVQLAAPLAGVEPVDLYTARHEAGQTVVMVGNGDHGTGRTGPTDNDGRMRAATNRVDEASDVYLTWRFDDPRTHPERATELEGISGPGDSGGPAFIEVDGAYRIAGISSGQSTRATGGKEGRYGVTEYYTRVSTYQTWIEATLAE